jgi:hypothetical protein
MYTALATKADLAHQAQLFSERLERLRLEIRADRLEDMATLRAEMRAMRDELRLDMHAGTQKLDAADTSILAEMHAGFRKLEAADAAILAEMHAGFRKLEDADAAIRVEIAQLANTLTLRMGAGLAAVAGLVIAAQQLL